MPEAKDNITGIFRLHTHTTSVSPSRMHKKKREFKSSLHPIKPVGKVHTTLHSKVVPTKDGGEGTQFASCIMPWLFLGCAQDGANVELLARYRITHIVNLAPEARVCEVEGIEYTHVQIRDHSDQPISEHFNEVFAFIDSCRAGGGKVLVHCRYGVSRSATLVIAYLMHHLSIPFVLAKDIVKQARPNINPNIGFVTALSQFQRDQVSIDPNVPLTSYKERLAEWSLTSSLTIPGAYEADTDHEENTSLHSSPPSPNTPTKTHSTGIACH
ncbi:putative rhodanese domain-containing dual specificity protein phosphatase [Diplonema papillatum]|nr:putative rhodanese domain-containing dual specificity protein phosphatase [Diplonema papillatum]